MALAQGAVCISTAPPLTQATIDLLKFFDAHVNLDNKSIPQIQSLLRLMQPYWSATGLEELQGTLDQLKRAGLSAITQNILIAAAYKRAAKEATNPEQSSLYETYSLLALYPGWDQPKSAGVALRTKTPKQILAEMLTGKKQPNHAQELHEILISQIKSSGSRRKRAVIRYILDASEGRLAQNKKCGGSLKFVLWFMNDHPGDAVFEYYARILLRAANRQGWESERHYPPGRCRLESGCQFQPQNFE